MKHGHKAKEKSAKALQKPRAEKGRKEAGAKAVKAAEVRQGTSKAGGKDKTIVKGKAGSGAKAEASPTRLQLRTEAENKKRAGNGGPPSFANPAVGNAFRRAVKKYSVALKRLTD